MPMSDTRRGITVEKNLIAARLRAAQEKIADPKNWLQGTYAMTADGRSVPAKSPEAVRFCSVGAIRSTDEHFWVDDPVIIWLERAGMFGLKVTSFNDQATHEEVMGAFTRAIEKAELA